MRKATQKIYRAKLDSNRLSKVVGWPRYGLMDQPKKSFWHSVRALLF